MNQSPIHQPTPMSKAAFWYFFLVLLILTLLGFAGYYFGFLGFIYNVMIPGELGRFPLVILAIIFGTAAFFSPCSFSVLPAYVSHYIAGDPEKAARPVRRGIYFGFIAAPGVITINILVGLAIAALGSAAPFAKDQREDIALIFLK